MALSLILSMGAALAKETRDFIRRWHGYRPLGVDHR